MAESSSSSRAAIDAVLRRYFWGIDSQQRAVVLACFADDARIRYGRGHEARGIDEIRRLFEGGAVAREIGLEITSTMHTVSAVEIELDGDRATSVLAAVAHLVGERDGAGRIVVRGLRYEDALCRRDNGWKIVDRHHSALWMYEVVSEPV
ncbi:MAG TPA: nuclear transport factor 2 family protein [Acidimicrobiales bacterium]